MERSFAPGADAQLVGTQAAAFIGGMGQAGVGSAVKHFPGLGAVPVDTDAASQGITDITTTADGAPTQAFKLAFGVPSRWTDEPAGTSRRWSAAGWLPKTAVRGSLVGPDGG